jgi:hypothetical protein
MSERYVVLGLARPRADWFGAITRWATEAALPVEFVKCLTVDELRARLTSGRAWSCVLLDARAPGVERDLIDIAESAGATVLIIDDPRVDRPWVDLGARAVLKPDLTRDQLLAALAEHTRPIARVEPRPAEGRTVSTSPWRGTLVAVTGTGGVGASTLAATLAQGYANDVTQHGLVLLADLALHADQAVIHDPGDIMPGLPELVDAHRRGRPESDEIRRLTFSCGERGYHLLLGLRRHREWTTLRFKAAAAALDGLRRSYRVVVADVDQDIEGESETGSIEIEERNLLARLCIEQADAVVAVGSPGVAGVHQLARLVRDLVAADVDPVRILPVLNRCPRSRRRRAEVAHALAHLCGPQARQLATAITVPDRPRLEEVIRSGGRWPEPLARDLHRAAESIINRPTNDVGGGEGLVRVQPGSLGHFTDLEADEA